VNSIDKLRRNSTVSIFLYLIGVSALLFALFSRHNYDDPFITYRYADNLRHGLGFVYNPGERVQSTTTPLFTLILAGLSWVWSDMPHLANLIGAFSTAMGSLFLWYLAQAWKSPWVGWSSLLLYPTFSLVLITFGSETPLYIALCIGSYTFYTRKRYTLTAVSAALAVLARPDGILVVGILAVDYLLKYLQGRNNTIARRSNDETIPWLAVLIFLAITLSWFIFAWVYFGSPLPATLAAKQQQGAMAISQRFAAGFLTILGWYTAWPYKLEAALAALGFIFMIWRAHRWALFLAWTVLYFVAYSILGVSRYFWYYAPLVPGFVVAVGLGMAAIAGYRARVKILSIKVRTQLLSFNLQQFLTVTILVLLSVAQSNNLWRARQPDQRYAIYHAAGEWLATNTPSISTVGALEVGIIGYYAHRPMLDFAGLIQPEVAVKMTRNTTYEDTALWAVAHYRPDYLVLFSGVFPRLEQSYVKDHCQLAQKFTGESYNYLDLDIYACR
jgi:hypothetical protein